MKLLVTGAGGLLGSRVVEMAEARGHEVYSGYAHRTPDFGRAVRFDLGDRQSISKMIEGIAPDVIIHGAALTDVDRCERERILAHKLNVEATRSVADAADMAGSFLIYISTDYVFDGGRGMYREDDPTNPVSFYGKTKLLGESFCKGCIARTCVIYGSRPASGKVNFALWLLQNLRAGKEVRVVTDQFITPTLNTNLAAMLLEAASRRVCGIYHLAGATRTSRYDFAGLLADVFELDSGLIIPSKMADMKWDARRPMDSSLETVKALREFDAKPLFLNEALRTLKDEISNEVG